jgi:hypothetical protein
MLEQVSNSVKFLAFYTASKQGKTGLTVTVDIYSPSGTQIVTAGSATALGGGLYSYTLSTNNSAEGEYAAIFKTADATVDAQHIPSLWVLGRAGVENLDAATSTRLPSSSYAAAPSVTAIRTEMDSNSTQLSAIKSKTDTLPSDPADQSLLEAAIAGVTAPSASAVATAVRSELSVELARVDAAVSSRAVAGDIPSANISAIKAKTDLLETTRLAQCSTVATTGAQLAAALS